MWLTLSSELLTSLMNLPSSSVVLTSTAPLADDSDLNPADADDWSKLPASVLFRFVPLRGVALSGVRRGVPRPDFGDVSEMFNLISRIKDLIRNCLHIVTVFTLLIDRKGYKNLFQWKFLFAKVHVLRSLLNAWTDTFQQKTQNYDIKTTTSEECPVAFFFSKVWFWK